MDRARCIVVAVAEEGMEVDPTSRPRIDLGERPRMIPTRTGRACVWLNRGSDADIEKARAWAAREGWRVFVYPVNERDPLGRARREVLV